MNFAIIAAGDGSRLAQEGIKSPKPLIRINGEIMIERLVRIFLKAGASSVIIIHPAFPSSRIKNPGLQSSILSLTI